MKRYTAPMPPELRHQLRAGHHPSRAVPCPHCEARAHTPCKLRTRDHALPKPHPQRLNAWALQTACCPACQVEPTVPCHDGGIPRATVHARRYQEAEETLA